MFGDIPHIFSYLTGLIIITSVLTLITQYFDNLHKGFMNDRKEKIENIGIPRTRTEADLKRQLQDRWGNRDPTSLSILIATLLVTLVFIAFIFTAANITPDGYVLCNGRVLCFFLSSWIFLVALSVFINMLLLLLERRSLAEDLQKVERSCEIIGDVLAENEDTP